MINDFFWRHSKIALFLLLALPLAWLGVMYIGSLMALLVQSFYAIDNYSGVIIREFTLKTYLRLLEPAHLDIIIRTLLMVCVVSIACTIIALPIAFFAVKHVSGWWKALVYLAVMLPLWSSYVVKIYAWKLILAKEGIISWMAEQLHLTGLLALWLELPVIGGNSLSVSYTGTFITFVYVWLPYMILPVMAALEKVPKNLLEASADLGASNFQTFYYVIWLMVIPGIIAGSIFTFSLTLGDYIIPQVIGNSQRSIGWVVYEYQGTAGDIPMAAVFTVVPIFIMTVYLYIAKRQGVFDAL